MDLQRRLTVGIVINLTLIAFEALAVTAVAPRAARDLGGIPLYGWLFSAFMLAQLVSVVVAGHASDRSGPAPVLAVGYALFTAGLVVSGLAPTIDVLIAGRVLQGLGAGALFATAYVVIGMFDEAERPRQLAFVSTAWVVPGLLAPALGGIIAEQVGWRFVFVGLIPLSVVGAALALPAVARLPHRDGGSEALPVGPAILLAGGAGMLLLGAGEARLGLMLVLVTLGAAVAVPTFRRLTPPGTLRAAPGLPAAVATRGVLTFSFFGADAFFALALAALRDFDPLAVGLALTPPTMGFWAGSWLQVYMVGRWSRRSMATAGAVLLLVSVAAVATVVAPGVAVAVPIAGWSLGGLGLGLAYNQTSLVALSAAGEGRTGAASASLQMTEVLGIAMGTGAAGAIISLAPTIEWTQRDALALVFGLMALAAVVAVLAARRLPPDPAALHERVDRLAQ